MKKKVKIKDVALYSKGTQINGDELLEEAKFDYLNGGIKPSGKWDNANCVANTVTISEGGNSCGYVNFMKNPFWCGAHCYFLYDTKIDSKYLYYVLKSQQVRIMKLRSGACMPNIKKTDLGNFEFVCDDNSIEQKKITHILDKLECVIEQRKNEIQVFDELVKARFVEMFGTEQEMNKWNCCTVGDVADVSVGVVIKPTQYYSDVGIPAFRSLNVCEMHVNDNDWVYFTREGHEKNKKSIIKNNDVLVVRSGTPGTACVATQKYEGYNAVDIMIARPYQEKIDSTFLAAFTNMPHGMNQIKTKTGGAAQKHFNVREYKTLTIILPSLKVQQQFADFVRQDDKSKAVIEKSLKELETLQASLMQKYFS